MPNAKAWERNTVMRWRGRFVSGVRLLSYNIRELLERSLAQEHAVGVHHIAASLGYTNEGYLEQTFPELCHAIGEKCRGALPVWKCPHEWALIRSRTTALASRQREEQPSIISLPSWKDERSSYCRLMAP
jgi:hypothetical protein